MKKRSKANSCLNGSHCRWENALPVKIDISASIFVALKVFIVSSGDFFFFCQIIIKIQSDDSNTIIQTNKGLIQPRNIICTLIAWYYLHVKELQQESISHSIVCVTHLLLWWFTKASNKYNHLLKGTITESSVALIPPGTHSDIQPSADLANVMSFYNKLKFFLYKR